MTAAIEGLALERPRRSVAAIHRIVRDSMGRDGAWVPSYATVHAVVRSMDPAFMVLAHEGAKAYTHTYDLLHRREATRPNEIWQADHTELDILAFDEAGATVRPWLTVVIDDHSRAGDCPEIGGIAERTIQSLSHSADPEASFDSTQYVSRAAIPPISGQFPRTGVERRASPCRAIRFRADHQHRPRLADYRRSRCVQEGRFGVADATSGLNG